MLASMLLSPPTATGRAGALHGKRDRRRSRAGRRLILTAAMLALLGCQSPATETRTASSEDYSNASIESLLRAAEAAPSAAGAEYRLRAIELLISNAELARAEREYALLPRFEESASPLKARTAIAGAQLALSRSEAGGPEAGLEAARLLLDPGIDDLGLSSETAQSLNDQTWAALSALSGPQLDALATQSANYKTRGWIELLRSTRSEGFSLRGQLDSIARWKRVWAQHPAAARLPSALVGLAAAWEKRPRHIALILPLQQAAGRALQEGFVAAYYQSLAISREVPRISVIDSSGATDAQSLIEHAASLGAELIVGPLDKALVNELSRAPRMPVLTLALNYADRVSGASEDSARTASESLVQFGLAPEDEIDQIISLARGRGFTRAAVVTPEGENYLRLSEEFRSRWQTQGGDVVAQRSFGSNDDYSAVVKGLLAIDASEDRARRLRSTLPRNNIEFTPQRRGDIDFVFLIANPRQGRQIVPTLAFYYAQDLPLLALPSIYDGDPEGGTRDLDGVVFNDGPWMVAPSDLRAQADASLNPALGASQRLRAMGVDSFYLAMQLNQLQENPGSTLQGVTGLLRLENDGRIHRELLTARFRDGVAEQLPR